MIGPEMT